MLFLHEVLLIIFQNLFGNIRPCYYNNNQSILHDKLLVSMELLQIILFLFIFTQKGKRHPNHKPEKSLHHSITRSLHHHITTSLHHFITTSLHHYITSSLHHYINYITRSLHHYITTSPHHYITTSLHHSILFSSCMKICIFRCKVRNQSNIRC